MSLSIINYSTPDDQKWDELWDNCPYATFFQSREWAEIWSEFTKGKCIPKPIMFEFSDGKKVLMPFSFQKVYWRLSPLYISSPGGTFGGWIGPESLNRDHQQILMSFFDSFFPNYVWRSNPYEETSDLWKFHCAQEDTTLVLDLTVGFESIQKIWSSDKSAIDRKARKASREGVVITLANNRRDWENYFEIYKASVDRWGGKRTISYPWELFDIIWKRDSCRVKLWVANFKGEQIAGALCFYSRNHVVYWHGAALSNYFSLRPVNLLFFEIIRDACLKGYKWFDFNPSGNLEGVRSFKESFGAVPLPSNLYEKQTTFHGLLARLSKSLHPTGGKNE